MKGDRGVGEEEGEIRVIWHRKTKSWDSPLKCTPAGLLRGIREMSEMWGRSETSGNEKVSRGTVRLHAHLLF